MNRIQLHNLPDSGKQESVFHSCPPSQSGVNEMDQHSYLFFKFKVWGFQSIGCAFGNAIMHGSPHNARCICRGVIPLDYIDCVGEGERVADGPHSRFLYQCMAGTHSALLSVKAQQRTLFHKPAALGLGKPTTTSRLSSYSYSKSGMYFRVGWVIAMAFC
jgi:hypothetical protein